MDKDILKNFVKHDVEILVGGVWIEGHLQPIVNGQIVLLPIGESAAFYGPCAMKMEVIQAIRQVKKDAAKANATAAATAQSPPPVKSSLDSTPGHVGQRFVIAK